MEEGKIRIECRLPNASCFINGVRFAEVSPASVDAKGVETPAVLMSEEIDTLVAKMFIRIPGYAIAARDKDLAALVDEAIAKEASAPDAEQTGTIASLTRNVEELQRSNQAQSQELHEERRLRADAEERARKARAGEFEADIRRLNARVVELEEALNRQVAPPGSRTRKPEIPTAQPSA